MLVDHDDTFWRLVCSSEILVDESDFSPIAIEVQNHLTTSTEWLRSLRGTGMNVSHNLFPKLAVLNHAIIAALIEHPS